eukprot:scaffold2800_cov135-Isochrysis_galbana.AAC.3
MLGPSRKVELAETVELALLITLCGHCYWHTRRASCSQVSLPCLHSVLQWTAAARFGGSTTLRRETHANFAHPADALVERRQRALRCHPALEIVATSRSTSDRGSASRSAEKPAWVRSCEGCPAALGGKGVEKTAHASSQQEPCRPPLSAATPPGREWPFSALAPRQVPAGASHCAAAPQSLPAPLVRARVLLVALRSREHACAPSQPYWPALLRTGAQRARARCSRASPRDSSPRGVPASLRERPGPPCASRLEWLAPSPLSIPPRPSAVPPAPSGLHGSPLPPRTPPLSPRVRPPQRLRHGLLALSVEPRRLVPRTRCAAPSPHRPVGATTQCSPARPRTTDPTAQPPPQPPASPRLSNASARARAAASAASASSFSLRSDSARARASALAWRATFCRASSPSRAESRASSDIRLAAEASAAAASAAAWAASAACRRCCSSARSTSSACTTENAALSFLSRLSAFASS